MQTLRLEIQTAIVTGGSAWMPGSSLGMTNWLASLPAVATSDIRRGTMIAGQKLIKLFALPTAVPPGGKSAQPAAKKFYDARGRRSGCVQPGAENLRCYVGKIAIGHDTRSKNNMSAISLLGAAAATRLLTAACHCSNRERF
jgi:hypothetical protein